MKSLEKWGCQRSGLKRLEILDKKSFFERKLLAFAYRRSLGCQRANIKKCEMTSKQRQVRCLLQDTDICGPSSNLWVIWWGLLICKSTGKMFQANFGWATCSVFGDTALERPGLCELRLYPSWRRSWTMQDRQRIDPARVYIRSFIRVHFLLCPERG